MTIGPLEWGVMNPDPSLVKATVNETQAYVELSMEDNVAYRGLTVK
ncbi:MAG: hypothetical protein ABIK44_01770 [candidate division WOR-3 bacterium]